MLAVLRLTDADVDAERIETLIPVAARSIDADLDRPEAVLGPPPAPEIHEALIQRTVELYQSKTPNPAGGFGLPPQFGDSSRRLILAHKQRWGIG